MSQEASRTQEAARKSGGEETVRAPTLEFVALRVCQAALGGLVLIAILGRFAGGGSALWLRWVEGIAPFLAAGAAGLAIANRLSNQNALGAVWVTWALTALTWAVAQRTGRWLPAVVYQGGLGPALLDAVPLGAPFLWTAILLSCRETARIILRPWRRAPFYGYWIVLLASALALLTDLVMEPFAVRAAGWWSYDLAEGKAVTVWAGIPIQAVLTWFAVALGTILIATAWLVGKRSASFIPSWDSPLAWMILIGWFAAGDLRAGLWLPAILGAAMLAASALLVRNGIRVAREKVNTRAAASEAD